MDQLLKESSAVEIRVALTQKQLESAANCLVFHFDGVVSVDGEHKEASVFVINETIFRGRSSDRVHHD